MLRPRSLFFVCTCVLAPFFLLAQSTPAIIGLSEGNVEFVSPQEVKFASGGVRNRSQSRGLVIRYETQPGFDWRVNADTPLAGSEETVTHLEQFTFKFKIPVLNKPDLKVLLGYEWDTEKYFFDDPFSGEPEPTFFQLLDERRLKQNKLSAYVTKAFNERFYVTGRVRMSLNGDYAGLIDFAEIYRNYSAGVGFGKKISEDEGWAVGLSFSTNKLRTIALPFFLWNKTFTDNFGMELGLPAQAFIRWNVGSDKKNSFLFGPKFESKFYAINKDEREDFSELGRFFLRRNGIKLQLQYEHNIAPWVWAFGQGGYYLPINNRFNQDTNLEVDLDTTVGGRPFVRAGIFLAPPKDLIK